MMLFADPVIPGLDLRERFVHEEEEGELIARIDDLGLSPFRFHGWTGKRLTHSFGWRYDFDDASFTQTEPIPDWLLPMRARAAALAGLAPDAFAHALVVRYDPGAGIGWHRDRPQFDRVVGISLGAATTMRFRQRTVSGFRRASVRLEPRSAYLLSGEVRSAWEHSIAAHEALRFSITFRSLSALGLRSRSAPPPPTAPPSVR
jgi:alkylated DNA repair protein (DNA oxidative demethylase)